MSGANASMFACEGMFFGGPDPSELSDQEVMDLYEPTWPGLEPDEDVDYVAGLLDESDDDEPPPTDRCPGPFETQADISDR